MLGNIVIFGVLTRWELLHSVSGLKATQMNVQYSLIGELRLYEVKPDHYTAEAAKNIYRTKG